MAAAAMFFLIWMSLLPSSGAQPKCGDGVFVLGGRIVPLPPRPFSQPAKPPPPGTSFRSLAQPGFNHATVALNMRIRRTHFLSADEMPFDWLVEDLIAVFGLEDHDMLKHCHRLKTIFLNYMTPGLNPAEQDIVNGFKKIYEYLYPGGGGFQVADFLLKRAEGTATIRNRQPSLLDKVFAATRLHLVITHALEIRDIWSRDDARKSTSVEENERLMEFIQEFTHRGYPYLEAKKVIAIVTAPVGN